MCLVLNQIPKATRRQVSGVLLCSALKFSMNITCSTDPPGSSGPFYATTWKHFWWGAWAIPAHRPRSFLPLLFSSYFISHAVPCPTSPLRSDGSCLPCRENHPGTGNNCSLTPSEAKASSFTAYADLSYEATRLTYALIT